MVTCFVDGNATNTATGTIKNDDNLGSGQGISATDLSVNEGVCAVDFVITYTGQTVQDSFTVAFEITDGSAISPEDYTVVVAAGSVTFPANTVTGTTQTVQITIVDDTISENTKNQNITLSNCSNLLISIIDADGVGSITDNNKADILVEVYKEEMTITCSEDIPEAPKLVFSGGCGNYVVDFSETEQATVAFDNFTIIRIWKASETCGNTATFKQLISIKQAEKKLVTIDICIEDLAIDLLDYLPTDFDAKGVFKAEDGVVLDGTKFDSSIRKIGTYQI